MIRDVCADNFDEEFEYMLNYIEDYPYVTIDTEFPGIVLEPTLEPGSTGAQWNYAQLRDNVNALKLIQLGLSFSDSQGRPAPGGPCWQFNFRFDLTSDMYAADAIEMLSKAGLDFDKHKNKGIWPEDFGERVMSSGLVLNENVRWISFHGLYDFGYLLKVCTSLDLPDSASGFFEQLDLFYPRRCDIKYLLRNECRTGLSVLGSQLGCSRRGQAHQGGSDALLTGDVFFALNDQLRETAFDGSQKDCGGLFGLSDDDKHCKPFYTKSRMTHNAPQQTSPFHTPSREPVPLDRQLGISPHVPVNVPPYTPPQSAYHTQDMYMQDMRYAQHPDVRTMAPMQLPQWHPGFERSPAPMTQATKLPFPNDRSPPVMVVS
jgi:CCR4-NOT transcription complex subunit 7/8